MEAITKYKAADGSEWDSQYLAGRRERARRFQAAANEVLGDKKPDGNGATYVQHTVDAVHKFTMAIAAALGEFESHEMRDRWLEQPRGIVGRFLDDTGSIFYRDYIRLISIDSQNREWGQPYYANNPNPEAIPA